MTTQKQIIKESIVDGFTIIERSKKYDTEEDRNKQYNEIIDKLEEVLYNE